MLPPGGYGTMGEMVGALLLVATGKITRFPVVLAGSACWSGWTRQYRPRQHGRQRPGPFTVAGVPGDLVKIITGARAETGFAPPPLRRHLA